MISRPISFLPLKFGRDAMDVVGKSLANWMILIVNVVICSVSLGLPKLIHVIAYLPSS